MRNGNLTDTVSCFDEVDSHFLFFADNAARLERQRGRAQIVSRLISTAPLDLGESPLVAMETTQQSTPATEATTRNNIIPNSSTRVTIRRIMDRLNSFLVRLTVATIVHTQH